MNRAQKRAMMKTGRKRDLSDAEQAKVILDGLSVGELVAGINNSINILKKRGVSIVDWDARGRKLYKVSQFGRKVCFLASDTEDEV